MRPALVLVFLLLSLAFSHALTFDLEKKDYFKGETLSLAGECGPGETFNLTIYWQGVVLASDSLVCPNTGRYQYSFPITFENPAGQWRVVLGPFFQNITVHPSAESSRLSLKFFQPSKEVNRNQDFKIVVGVLSQDGRPLNDAKVTVWDSFGGKYALKHEGSGNYSAQGSLPLDARIGDLDFTAVAVSADGASGGRASYAARVSQARIDAVISVPEDDFYEAAQEIPFQITVQYENGQPLSEPIVVIVEDDVNHFPRKIDPKNFFLEFIPSDDREGEIPLKVMVFDSADNTLVKEWDIVLHRGLFWYSKKYGAFLLAGVIIIMMLYFVAGKRMAADAKRETIKSKIRDNEAGIRKLQKRFFDGEIDRKNFKSESFKLEQRIAKLRKGLKD